MKIKSLILIFITGIISISANAQFMHIGVKTFASPFLNMKFYEYADNEYVFYFSNEQNETIRFDGIKDARVRSMKPYPAIYIRYDNGFRWFFELNAYYFWFTNEASYKNSVDLTDYSSVFNTANNQQIVNYNSMQLNWRFAGNRFFAGYIFMKKKSLRPFVMTGFNFMYLMNISQGESYSQRDYRNKIIFNHLATFAPITFYNTSGFGLQYKGIRFSIYWQQSAGNIDIYAKDYKTKSNLTIDSPHPNYQAMSGVFTSLSVNILSVNTKKTKLKDAILNLF